MNHTSVQSLGIGEKKRIQRAINDRVYKLATPGLALEELFRQLHRAIKSEYNVTTYHDLQSKDMLAIVRFIAAWQPKGATEA
ncbi:ORF6C domain-containing protein [Paenibacillus sp. ACRRX]|uniref:ORF6C domain-containing protein n=1 Tax=Paenibacillus sp. ACRRX TaxID=2918206 RepID=UPI001EF6DF23|nr:ORF6C domain-containing protein [Paenibacillus sp. ACRRX]MCG7410597.1 ORF6C domain-containing protein [Paenibacillus sp. ACRRX]